MTQTSEPSLRIGIVGCGNISMAYLRNAPLFRGVEIVACADINPDAAARRAAEFGIRAMEVDALIADPTVDLVLNLTIPAAHFDISMAALSAGKHVFTEKPLAVQAEAGRTLVAAAAARGLALGSAPDTFLGAAGRLARRLMEQGRIGTPVTGTAFMLGRGMEHWHPDPSFYYQAGAGPVMDMGPYYLTMMVNLMGPVRRVQAVATSGQAERLITAAGPKARHTVQGGHADQRPVTARVRLRRDRHLRRIVGRLPSLQPSDRTARHQRIAATAGPRQFRRSRRRLRRRGRVGGDRHLHHALRSGELAG